MESIKTDAAFQSDCSTIEHEDLQVRRHELDDFQFSDRIDTVQAAKKYPAKDLIHELEGKTCHEWNLRIDKALNVTPVPIVGAALGTASNGVRYFQLATFRGLLRQHPDAKMFVFYRCDRPAAPYMYSLYYGKDGVYQGNLSTDGAIVDKLVMSFTEDQVSAFTDDQKRLYSQLVVPNSVAMPG